MKDVKGQLFNRDKFPEGFYSGLSGLQLKIPKYNFPPLYQTASRLTYYASFFNSIEINSSFYKIPAEATVLKWAAMVDENFKFTFKIPKTVTHAKGLKFPISEIEQFMQAVEGVGNKKGCLLIQLPPGTGRECRLQLEHLLNCLERLDPQRHWNRAVEFRNRSWYDFDIYSLLEMYRVALVIQDIPHSATPRIDSGSAHAYFRFHGPSGNYRDSYPETFISEYAGYIQELLDDQKTVYTYFNNTMGQAFDNLEKLNGLVRLQGN